jgi:ubiquinone/menaquinone biosynthesis C-methylase UbiE
MDSAELDRFAEEYDARHRENIALSGEDPAYFAAYKVAEFARFSAPIAQDGARILDFGAGTGNCVPFFRAHFPHAALTLADVSARDLAISRRRRPGRERYTLIAGREIPHAEDAFDLAFSAGVFHHIPHAEHRSWLAELRRVIRTGGMLTIFEHNPRNPLTVRAVRSFPFDRDAVLVEPKSLICALEQAGWTQATLRYHVFFPHALRALRPLESCLRRVPLGAQYSVTAWKGSGR